MPPDIPNLEPKPGPRPKPKDIKQQIYEVLIAHCQPFVPRECWRQLSHPAAFSFVDAETVLKALREQFSDEGLKRAGILVSEESAGEVLNPALASGSGILVPLRRAPNALPFDILTDEGCLSGRIPVLAVTEDQLPVSLDNSWDQNIIIAPSMEDVVVLRSLGIRAAPAAGLASIAREELQAFCHLFGLRTNPRPGSGTPTAASRLGVGPRGGEWLGDPVFWQLLFMNWSLARMDDTPLAELAAIEAHFVQLSRHLEASLQNVYKWSASKCTLEGIAFSLKYGEISDLRKKLGQSSDDDHCHSLEALDGGLAGVFNQPSGFGDASAQIEIVRRGKGDKEVRRQAWRNYEESLAKDVIRPILNQIDETQDPVHGALLSLLAVTLHLYHNSVLSANEKLAASIDASGLAQATAIPKDQLQTIIALGNQQVHFIKEYYQWTRLNKSRGVTASFPPRLLARPPDSAGSGSPATT